MEENTKVDKSNRENDGKTGKSKNRSKRFSKGSYKSAGSYANNSLTMAGYVQSEQIMRDVASLPFSNVLRGGINIRQPLGQDDREHITINTPGMMRFGVLPTIGANSEATDGVQVAMRSIYSYIRHANSGHANYDAPDLMMYLLAMDSAYMAWAHLVRLYGVANTYNFKNRYYPEVIFNAYGIKWNPSALPELRAYINNLAIRLTSLAVPTCMPLFQRHFSLFQNIYLDRSSGKAQSYMFAPDYLYSYAWGDGKLEPVDMIPSGTKWTISKLIDTIETMIAPLFCCEDVGIMSGDILKAYGPSGIYAFAPIPEEYAIIPLYDEGVLRMIHNLRVCECTASDITQDMDTGLIHQQLMGSSIGMPRFKHEYLINCDLEEVSPVDVVDMVRFCAMSTSSDTNINKLEVRVYGTEVCTSAQMYKLSGYSNDGSLSFSTTDFNNYQVLDANENYPAILDAALEAAEYAMQFNWAPQVDIFVYAPDDVTDLNVVSACEVIRHHHFVDLDNYTIITEDRLKSIFDAISASLYGIPYTLTRA